MPATLDLIELQDYVLPRMAAWDVPAVAVGVTNAQQTLVAAGFGRRDLASGAPADGDTFFAIASNTKAFVATALGLLVQEKRLSWDDPVRRHLPEFELYDPQVSADIRVRDLLCHRGGLATYAGDLLQGSTVSSAEIVRRLRYLPQGFPFRSGFGYCNLLYLAAAEVLTAVSGEPWEAFIRRRLLEPLGMRHSLLSARELPSGGNVATPYEEAGGRLVPVAYHVEDNLGPPGGICSTAADVCRWLRFQLNRGLVAGQAIVEPAILEETRTPHTPLRPTPSEWVRFPGSHLVAYGLGWSLMDYHGRLLVRHTGGLDGMLSVSGFVPDDGVGIVVLTNRNPNRFFLALFYHLLDRALDLPPTDHNARLREQFDQEVADEETARRKRADARPQDLSAALSPAALTGAYDHPYLSGAQVAQETDGWTLRLEVHPGKSGSLEPWDADTVLCRWSEPGWQESLLPVERDGSGQVTGFRMKVRDDWIDSHEYRFRRVAVPGSLP